MSRADNPNGVSEYFSSRLRYKRSADNSSELQGTLPVKTVFTAPAPVLKHIAEYNQFQK